MRDVILVFLALCSFSTVSVHASPEDEARKIVREAALVGRSDSKVRQLLAILIAHPTEPVLVQAAQWPWAKGILRSNIIKDFLGSWVTRSPKLAEFFRKSLFGLDTEARNVAIEMLAPTLSQDQKAHAFIRQLASEGNIRAITALAPFVGIIAEDRNTIISLLTKEKLFSYESITAVEILSKNPRTAPMIKGYLLDQLRNPEKLEKNEYEVLNNILDGSHLQITRDSDLLAELKKLPPKLVGSNGLKLRTKIIRILLHKDPSDAQAQSELVRLVTDGFKSDLRHPALRNLFGTAGLFLGRIPRLDRAIDQGFDASLQKIKSGEIVYDTVDLFDLYFDLHGDAGSFDPKKIREFLDMLPEQDEREPYRLVKKDICKSILRKSDLMPANASELLETAKAHVTAADLAGVFWSRDKIPAACLEVAYRDISSADERCFFAAIRIIEGAGKYEKKHLEKLRSLASSETGWKKIEVIEALRRIDPSVPEAESPSMPDLVATKQRKLLDAVEAPLGWRQVVQAYALDLENDPFLMEGGLDAKARAAAEQGMRVRERYLAEAEHDLRRAGLVIQPIEWVRQRFVERRKEVVSYKHDVKINAGEMRKIEAQAKAKVLSLYPNVTADDLAQSPYRELYQRTILEMEWSLKKAQTKPEQVHPEVMTKAWRQGTLAELQDAFRESLRTVIRSRHGDIIVSQPRGIRIASDAKTLLLRESDLPEIHLLPSPNIDFYRAEIEWHGQVYEMDFRPRSIEGVTSARSKRNRGNPEEIAALTLGARRSSLKEVAQEIYLKRTFSAWINHFQQACTLLREEASNRFSSDLRNKAELERKWLQDELHPRGVAEAVVATLWGASEKDPNYWRDRETKALDHGRSDWQIVIPIREKGKGQVKTEVPPSLSQHKKSAMPTRDEGADAPREAIEDRSSKGVWERKSPHNKPREQMKEAQERMAFRIERVKDLAIEKVPQVFSEGFLDEFISETNINKISGASFDHSSSDFVLHSEKTLIANERIVSIDRPYTSSNRYDLRSLQVFSAQGKRLYAGRDYELIENKRTGNLAIRLLNANIDEVRFSAGFALGVRRHEPPAPRIETRLVRDIIPQLKEAGFTVLADALREAVDLPENKENISAVDLSLIFKSTGVYAEGNETDLGQFNPKILERSENPFLEFIHFLNTEGKVCAQCDGTNALFSMFLNVALGPENPYQIETNLVFHRKPNSLTIGKLGHATTVVYSPAHGDPLELDVTPSNSTGLIYYKKESPKQKIAFLKWIERLRSWFKKWKEKVKEKMLKAGRDKTRQLKEAKAAPAGDETPIWVKHVQDQVPEPPPVEAVHEKVSHDLESSDSPKARELRSGIQNQENNLELQIKEWQREGIIPRDRALDPTEPLVRAQLLARLAKQVLDGSVPVDAARSRLHKISTQFQAQQLETKAETLAAIGNYAREDRERFEKYVRSTKASSKPYYQNPHLRDRINLVYRSLEDLAHPAAIEVRARKAEILNALEKTAASCAVP